MSGAPNTAIALFSCRAVNCCVPLDAGAPLPMGAITTASSRPLDGGRATATAIVMAMAMAVLLLVSVTYTSATSSAQAQEGLHDSASSPDPYAATIADAARRFAIPEGWIRAVMRASSSNEPSAVSPVGAIGLMQLLPATYEELRRLHGLGADPFDPDDNIVAGTAYLREMLDRFGADGFLAAYSLGPERYEGHLSGGKALPDATVSYVAELSAIVVEARSHDAITRLIGGTFAALAAPSLATFGGSSSAAELAMPMLRIVDLTALPSIDPPQWETDIYAAPLFIGRAATPGEAP